MGVGGGGERRVNGCYISKKDACLALVGRCVCSRHKVDISQNVRTQGETAGIEEGEGELRARGCAAGMKWTSIRHVRTQGDTFGKECIICFAKA